MASTAQHRTIQDETVGERQYEDVGGVAVKHIIKWQTTLKETNRIPI